MVIANPKTDYSSDGIGEYKITLGGSLEEVDEGTFEIQLDSL